MKKYKLLCLDMDGTLLSRSKNVTPLTKKKLLQARRKGLLIVLATGRIYENAAYYADQLDLAAPIIASNGAIVKDEKGKTVYKKPLDIKYLREVLIICNRYRMKLNFHTDNNKMICASRLMYFLAKEFMKKSLVKEANGSIDIQYMKNYEEFWRVIERDHGCFIRGEIVGVRAGKLRRLKRALCGIYGIEAVSSDKRNIEITAQGVSKGNAVKMLADKYRIEQKEIIAIGDNENDISMIEYAELGVAMGNAITTLKEKANYITDTNNRDGIAKVIDQFVL